MDWVLLFAVLLALIAAVAAWLKSRGATAAELPYTKSPALLSPAERSFLGVLDQAVGSRYRVFAKVRVADVVGVQSMRDRSAWQRAFNKISAKHFDFVLCAADDLSVVAVVELDDKSHKRSKRRERDSFLVDLCEAISLPLIQVPAQRAYSVSEIRAQVLQGGAPA